MLLTDELEQVYSYNKADLQRAASALFERLGKRLPDGSQGVSKSIVAIKQIDNAWRFFCRSHKEFNKDGFRKIVLDIDKTGKLKKALNW